MNPATNIIYKAKSVSGEWVKGDYTYWAQLEMHKIYNRETYSYNHINPDTLCIGCVIDGKEYFAGDEALWSEYGRTGVIEFSLNGFKANFGDDSRRLYSLISCAGYITITGNIHD